VAGVRLTVRSPAVPPSGEPPAVAGRLVLVDVDYRNVGSAPVIVDPYDWSVVDASGNVYVEVTSDLPQRDLPRGASVRGVVGFDVPPSARGLVLRFAAELGDATATVPLG